METIDIPVQFIGQVTVKVPAGLSADESASLAREIALSRMLATTDNPDSPDFDAFNDLLEHLDIEDDSEQAKKLGKIWDKCQLSVSGEWTHPTFYAE